MDDCGATTVYSGEAGLIQSGSASLPPCCLPGHFADLSQAHGGCTVGDGGQKYDVCAKPALLPCQGRDAEACSAMDPFTWCCNLEVYHCVCGLYATADQIRQFCSSQPKGGIKCDECKAAPQCQ